MIGARPICEECKHLHQNKIGYSCDAFPDGVHIDVLDGYNDHKKPLDTQINDIVFEQMEPIDFEKMVRK